MIKMNDNSQWVEVTEIKDLFSFFKSVRTLSIFSSSVLYSVLLSFHLPPRRSILGIPG